MFEVSLVELAVIGLVALLVLGPERLPRAARMAGLYLRKARPTWYSIRSDIERELAADDLKRAMKDTQRNLRLTSVQPAAARGEASEAAASARPAAEVVTPPAPPSNDSPDSGTAG